MADVGDGKDRPLMSEHEFEELHDSLTQGLMRDPDKLVRIRAAAENFMVRADHITRLMDITKTVRVKTAVTLYERLADKGEWPSVLAHFKFKEDRDDVQDALGLPRV